MRTRGEEDAASDTRVAAAISSLSEADSDRLEKVARRLMNSLGQLSQGRDWEDLLSEALARTLDDRRTWKEGIDFVHHLTQTMRSTCHTWRKSLRRAEKSGRSEAPTAERVTAGDEDLALSRAPSTEPDPVRRIAAQQELDRIKKSVEGDALLSEILAGWGLGMKGPELKEMLNLSENEYRAAARRLRRRLNSMDQS